MNLFGRSLAALLAAYLLAGLTFVVVQEIGEAGRPITERLLIDSWREVQCYHSSKRTCCGWGYAFNCPLTKTFVAACFAAAFSIGPVALMMLVVRRYHWRRPLSEILVGGGLGLAAAWVAAQIPDSDDVRPDMDILLFVIPGLLGGLSYWFIAGRPSPPVS